MKAEREKRIESQCRANGLLKIVIFDIFAFYFRRENQFETVERNVHRIRRGCEMLCSNQD